MRVKEFYDVFSAAITAARVLRETVYKINAAPDDERTRAELNKLKHAASAVRSNIDSAINLLRETKPTAETIDAIVDLCVDLRAAQDESAR
ncbi:MAG: hypothetical protein LBN32_01490 [Helicobacteraceae bacterium]|jgi:hypothetical protein|nr:hypothetical protein [Helicobacteraceae bacterium]